VLLTSPDNPEIKDLRKLLADPAQRRDRRAFVIEGFKILQFAKNIQTVYLREDVSPPDLPSCRRKIISRKIFKSLSDVESPQGILAVCAMPEPPVFAAHKKYIFLDRIQDPGNLGSIVRTAAALGLDGLICNKGCADIFAPKAVRASMGAVFTLDLLRGEIADFPGQIIAADLTGSAPEDLRLSGGYILAVGNEGQGLAPEVLRLARQRVALPFDRSRAESLNAAVAAGILLYLLQKK
jgi:TrmH family RNA methyltransferase